MARREFLKLVTGSAALGVFGSCAATPPKAAPMSPPTKKIRAICFDLFTLFDPRSVVSVAKSIVPEHAVELCDAWRVRQFEYSWLRVASGQYADFRSVTEDALLFAAKTRGLTFSDSERATLLGAYSKLDLWPDARASLMAWKRAGLRLAPLTNYSPNMLSELLSNAKVDDLFDAQLSTHAIKTFKPDPRAYALGPSTFGLSRAEIAFSAFGGWDAAGARWFGFPTFWVNRLGVPQEVLGPGPDATGPTLTELAQFVDSR
ncbi:MAG: haloacid dehalogenase type II [Polyangiaceae bacterium]